jgi:hypothetical protein
MKERPDAMGKLALNGGTPIRRNRIRVGRNGTTPNAPSERCSIRAVVGDRRAEGAGVRSGMGRFSRVDQCIAVTNGSHALEVVLLGAGIGAVTK